MNIANKLYVLLCVVIIGAMLVGCSSAKSTQTTDTTQTQVAANTATVPADTTANTSTDLQLVTPQQDTDIGQMI